jgi:tetratricopeptide (TPR) repeat protein
MGGRSSSLRSGKSSRSPVWARWSRLTTYSFGAFILALIVFGPAINGSFLFDDVGLPFADPRAESMPPSFWIGGVRPVLMATYWMNFLLSGRWPFAYHLVNLAFHTGTATLMYFIFEKMLEIASVKSDRRWYSIFGAVMFLIHPLQTESVDYIAGRSELVAGFFFAAAWLVFLRNFESKIGYRASITVIVLAAMAILAKESAIGLPAVLVATDLYWAGDDIGNQLRKRAKLYLPFAFGSILAVSLILHRLSSSGTAGFGAGITPLSYALTECKAILIYVYLFILPASQNGDWQLPFFHSLLSNWAWAYCGAILILISMTAYLAHRARLASFGLLIFLLMLLPTSSFIPIQDAVAERRTYMPLTGLILVTLALLVRLHLKLPMLKSPAIAVLVCLSLVSWHRSAVWASSSDFWLDAVQKNPFNSRAHFGLGTAKVQSGHCAEAAREFATAQSENYPDPEKVRWNLAEAYNCDNKPELALPIYQSIASSRPSAQVYSRIGYIAAKQGDSGAALVALENAVRLDPGDATATAYRGLVKIAMNDLNGAELDFRRALDLEPANQSALQGLSLLSKAKAAAH